MIKRPLAILGAVATLAIVWPVLTHGLADDALVGGKDSEALEYNPASAAAAARHAEQALGDGKFETAKAYGKLAIRDSVLSAAGLRSWALAEQGEGHLARASALMGQAASLGWRDEYVQLWVIAASEQAHDYAATMRHVDAMARVLGTAEPIQNVLDGLAAKPDAKPWLVAALGRQPFWRATYLTRTHDDDPQRMATRAALLAALATTPAPPTRLEVAAVTNSLVRGGDALSADNLLRQLNGTVAPVITDPGFEAVQADRRFATPFEWRILTTPGLTVEVASAPNGAGTGNALHVRSDGTSDGTVAEQLIRLSPGEHTVTIMAHSQLGMTDAFRLQLTCASQGSITLRSDPNRDRLPGRIVLKAEIPAGDVCRQQILDLVALAQEPPTPINVWFDNVSVS